MAGGTGVALTQKQANKHNSGASSVERTSVSEKVEGNAHVTEDLPPTEEPEALIDEYPTEEELHSKSPTRQISRSSVGIRIRYAVMEALQKRALDP